MTTEEMYEHLQEIPIYSTHEHHREDAFHANLDLETLFANSYVGWCANVPQLTADRRAFLESVGVNSYFVWLQKAIQSLYEFREPISVENWDTVSQHINDAHRNPNHHLTLLKENCRYIAAIEDAYWDPGSNLGHPELFKAVFRVDSFFHAFHRASRDHDGMNALMHFNQSPGSFDEFINWMESVIRNKRSSIVALKCASAYERTVDFGSPAKDEAARAYGKHPDEVTYSERKAFGDYVFHRICALAQELDLPIQVHVGLARIRGSNPMLFEPTIARHPSVTFVLFHGGFPWYHEVAGLAHNYGNVVIDLCWLPIISTTAAIQALHEYIEVSRSSNTITWGGDNWTSEESFGATLAFRHALARVLSSKVSAGYFARSDALTLAEKIAYRNAQRIYTA